MKPQDEQVKILLDWYRQNRRVLPWREEPTPYHVWVSEIMLQQTRVEAVKEYYRCFMKELPDVEALSVASDEKLLKLWEGLGYYSRVRNLKKAAEVIMETYDGKIPASYDELLTLPGIGEYTAGAISSIAFQRAVPAVDGNMLRIMARVRADETDISLPAYKKAVREELGRMIPEEEPGNFNQALMDLGAMVCIPNGQPKCENCPWSGICLAYKENKTAYIPVKSSKKKRRIEKKTLMIIRKGSKILLHKRPEKGLLAGLYEIPSMEGTCTKKAVLTKIKEMGFLPLQIMRAEDSKHIFSHIEWHMCSFVVRIDELPQESLSLYDNRDWYHAGEERKEPEWIFAEPYETKERFPIPSAFRAYEKYLKENFRDDIISD